MRRSLRVPSKSPITYRYFTGFPRSTVAFNGRWSNEFILYIHIYKKKKSCYLSNETRTTSPPHPSAPFAHTRNVRICARKTVRTLVGRSAIMWRRTMYTYVFVVEFNQRGFFLFIFIRNFKRLQRNTDVCESTRLINTNTFTTIRHDGTRKNVIFVGNNGKSLNFAMTRDTANVRRNIDTFTRNSSSIDMRKASCENYRYLIIFNNTIPMYRQYVRIFFKFTFNRPFEVFV